MPPSLGELVANAWSDTLELARYGHEPMTVGWLRGQAYVYLWDFRLGGMTWRPFATTRPEPPKPPAWNPFDSSALYKSFWK